MTEQHDRSVVSPVGDLLVRGVHEHPDRDLLVLPGARFTYADVHDRARTVARGLLGLGVQQGDHVGVLAANGIEYVEAVFGTWLLGAVVVPLNARHRATEIGYIVDNADLVAVLTTASEDEYVDFTAVLRESLPSLTDAGSPLQLELSEAPRLRSAVLLSGAGRQGFADRAELDALATGVDPARVDAARGEVGERDTTVVLYTSGTTANPKGCLLSHEAMTRGAVQRARERFASRVTWGAGPLFHIGSLAPFLGCVGVGGTYLTDVAFDPGRALELMQDEAATAAWPWFPAIVQGLIDHERFDPARLASLRTMLLIGPPTLHNRVQELLPEVEALQACGMTETAGIYALGDSGEPPARRAEAQGRPVPGVEVRIIDPETGADLPPGEVGEILVRGYCVMDGYYNDPQKTAETLDAEGWLHTGDLYLQTADGRLVFNGRLKDMLKVGGENVAALEVEAFLCEHPDIKLAEVVGAQDPRLDEVPVAFVELREGATVAPQEIIDWCTGRIARYKIPRAVHFMRADEWPMSATKVNKRALRQRLAAESGALAEPV